MKRAAGNRNSVAELSGRTVQYGYDSLYRLTSETVTADPVNHNGLTTYTYDPVGNRQVLKINGVTVNTYNYEKPKLEVAGGAAPLLSVQLAVNYLSIVDDQARVSYCWFGVARFGAVPCTLILSLRRPS